MKTLLFILLGALASLSALQRKADEGDPEAMYRLASLYERGYDSIAPDTAKSLSLLRRSAEAGFNPARNYLGFLYQRGEMVKQNPDSALFWIRLAADEGDPKAANNLAFLLLQTPSAPNDSLAVRYLHRAADADLPTAITTLGSLYAEGRGVPQDTAKAVALFDRAIGLGFDDAQLHLLNLKGDSWLALPPEERLDTAIRYWRLGSPLIAVELLQSLEAEAEATLSSSLIARTYALLGHAYSHGAGVSYDHAKANTYFAKAALLGDPAAQFIFAETLEIFPDALAHILPNITSQPLPASLSQIPSDSTSPNYSDSISHITASDLRSLAAQSGITDAPSALNHLLSPLTH